MSNGVILVQQGTSGPTFPGVGHSVLIRLRNTVTAVQVYSDSGLTTPLVTLGNPVTTGADGSIPGYVASGQSLDAFDQTANQTKPLEPLAASSVVNASPQSSSPLRITLGTLPPASPGVGDMWFSTSWQDVRVSPSPN